MVRFSLQYREPDRVILRDHQMLRRSNFVSDVAGLLPANRVMRCRYLQLCECVIRIDPI